MKITQAIRNIRKALLLQQGEFADLIGVSKASICNYESGLRRPRLPIIRKILELAKHHKIKVSPEDFLN
jgi:predicted transcriptional regulator